MTVGAHPASVPVLPKTPESSSGRLMFTTIAKERRAIPPEGLEDGPDTLAVISDDLAATWRSWGPTRASAPPAPGLAEGATALFVWDSGKGLRVEQVVSTPNGLVVVAVRERPPPGCGESAEVGGFTLVLAVEGVEAGTDASVEVTEVEVPCSAD